MSIKILSPFEAKKIIKKHIDNWSWLVTKYGWKFDIYYHEYACDMPEGGQGAAAFTTGHSQYLKAAIHFDLRACAEYAIVDLEEMVVHEITHMLIFPMQYPEFQPHDVEYVVTTISRMFVKLRTVQCQDPKVHTKK